MFCYHFGQRRNLVTLYNEILASKTFDVAVAFYNVGCYTVIFSLPVDFVL